MVIKNCITNANEKKLFIFDIDGTLMEYRTLQELVNEAFSSYGIEPKGEYFNMHGSAVAELLTRAIDEKCFSFANLCLTWQKNAHILDGSGITVSSLITKMIELESKYSFIYPNTKVALQYLKDLRKKIICDTNWFKESQCKRLINTGIMDYFDEVYTCENDYAKPSKEHFNRVLLEEGLNPRHAVMIGDSYSDIASVNAGIDSILIDYNQNKQKLYDTATSVVTDINDISKILK
jgi:FMN phosphatase YigB (HAD superfamily)